MILFDGIKSLKKTALLCMLSFSFSAFANEQSVEERLKRLEEMADDRGQLQADIMFQINAMQQELQQMRGLIEEHSHLLQQLQDL